MSGCLVVSKHVGVPVISIYFEPTLRRRKPTVNDGAHGKPAFAELESQRLLLASIACVAFHAKFHALTMPPRTCLVSCPEPPLCPVRNSRSTRGARRPTLVILQTELPSW